MFSFMLGNIETLSVFLFVLNMDQNDTLIWKANQMLSDLQQMRTQI